MPNHLEESIGSTGKFIRDLTQDSYVKKINMDKGACVAICAKWMCEISKKKIPTLRDSLEVAQWMHEEGQLTERLQMLTKSYGLKETGGIKGRLMYDEIQFGEFTRRSGKTPSFNMFGVDNTQLTEGHELLVFTEDGTNWQLLDPNFGIAEWPHFSGVAVGLKRLLRSAYAVFGPYYPFSIIKYEWA